MKYCKKCGGLEPPHLRCSTWLHQKWLTTFCQKFKILCSSGHTILFKFHQHACGQILINIRNVLRDFKLSMSASAMVTKKYPIRTWFFAVNLTLKLFRVTISQYHYLSNRVLKIMRHLERFGVVGVPVTKSSCFSFFDAICCNIHYFLYKHNMFYSIFFYYMYYPFDI